MTLYEHYLIENETANEMYCDIIKKEKEKEKMKDFELIRKVNPLDAARRKFMITYFPKNARGCEIGVFYGNYSQLILEIAKPEMLYLVDPWLYDDKISKEKRTVQQMEEIYQEVKKKFELFNNVVKIKRMTSFEFFENYTGEPLDFVYIDGCHEYECVYQDLIGAWKITKPGAVICGDDYIPNKHFGDNITRAVVRFCNEKQIDHKVFKIPGFPSQFLIYRSQRNEK